MFFSELLNKARLFGYSTSGIGIHLTGELGDLARFFLLFVLYFVDDVTDHLLTNLIRRHLGFFLLLLLELSEGLFSLLGLLLFLSLLFLLFLLGDLVELLGQFLFGLADGIGVIDRSLQGFLDQLVFVLHHLSDAAETLEVVCHFLGKL